MVADSSENLIRFMLFRKVCESRELKIHVRKSKMTNVVPNRRNRNPLERDC